MIRFVNGSSVFAVISKRAGKYFVLAIDMTTNDRESFRFEIDEEKAAHCVEYDPDKGDRAVCRELFSTIMRILSRKLDVAVESPEEVLRYLPDGGRSTRVRAGALIVPNHHLFDWGFAVSAVLACRRREQ